MIKLTNAQENVLIFLTIYKFLTNSQFVQLGGIRSHTNNMKGVVSYLIEQKLIKEMRFSGGYKKGKLESVFFLTQTGIRFVSDFIGIKEKEIKAPKNQDSFFLRDYQHRMNCISFEIFFRKWAESQSFNVHCFHRYFDFHPQSNTKKGNRLKPLTEITVDKNTFIQPDGVSIFATKERRFLFISEISMGTETGRIEKQNLNHALAIKAGLPSKQFSFEKGCFVVCIFEHSSCMDNVMKRMKQNPEFRGFEKYFLFKTIENLNIKNFFHDWLLFNGSRSKFLPC